MQLTGLDRSLNSVRKRAITRPIRCEFRDPVQSCPPDNVFIEPDNYALHESTEQGRQDRKDLMPISYQDPSMSSAARPLLAAIAAVAIWGASPAATAVAGRSIPPELIAGLRTLLAGLLLLPLLLRFRDSFPSGRREQLELTAAGVFGFAAYPLALSIGVLKTSVTHASLILAAAPIFTGLLSFLITSQWPKGRWWVGSAIALVGISVLIASRGSPGRTGASATLVGDALVLLSVLLASAGYVYGGRNSSRIGQWPATVGSIAIGSLASVLFTVPAISGFGWSTTNLTDISALAFLVVGVTILGYALWFRALAEAGAAAVAPLQFLQPLVGVTIAASFLGEAISSGVIVSSALIITGVWFARRA